MHLGRISPEEWKEEHDRLEVEHATLVIKKLRGTATAREISKLWALSGALAWEYGGNRRWKIQLSNERAICDICNTGANWAYTGTLQKWHDERWITLVHLVGHEDCLTEKIKEYYGDI